MSQKIINGFKKSISGTDAAVMLGNAWLYQTSSVAITASAPKRYYIETAPASTAVVFLQDLDFKGFGTEVQIDLTINPHLSASYSTSYAGTVTSSFTSSVKSGSLLTFKSLNGSVNHGMSFKMCENPTISASVGTLVATQYIRSGSIFSADYLWGLAGDGKYIVSVTDTANVGAAVAVPRANILVIDQYPYD